MSDDEYEYEEETSYVLFDVGNSVTDQLVDQVSRNFGGCRIIGLEEGKPFLQLGHHTFEGEIDDTIGTHLLFEIQENKRETAGLLPLLSSMRSESDNKQPKYTTTYYASSEKIVSCTPVSLKAKNDEFDQLGIKAKAAAQQRDLDDKENEYL